MSLPGRAALRRLPRGIWALGLVSLWMDVSSEMIHALLPVYLVTAMGTSVLTVGWIEGVAEATAAITKVFSGGLSDWLGRRKALAVAGYGLAAVTKPVFPLATSAGWVVAARFVDRVGKGIRGAPRDALVADLSPAGLRGASFGLRQALDTVGAFLGPLIAIGLMALSGGNIPLVFWCAVAPAFVAVALLIVWVPEPARPAGARAGGRGAAAPLSRAAIARLGPGFWRVTAVAVVLALARFSEAFLILRAYGEGTGAVLIPAVLVAMNVVYALAAYPAGALSDGGSRLGVLAIGAGLLVAADVVLALAPGLVGIGLGVALWGAHMGFTQGIVASLVADTAPPDQRGTAFGMLNLLTGVTTLVASVLAGALWDLGGPRATFLAGAALALVALAGLRSLRGTVGGTGGAAGGGTGGGTGGGRAAGRAPVGRRDGQRDGGSARGRGRRAGRRHGRRHGRRRARRGGRQDGRKHGRQDGRQDGRAARGRGRRRRLSRRVLRCGGSQRGVRSDG